MFAKVFSQILDSSLAEDYRVRLVFEDMLKLSDKNGIVDITRESIARRTNVPIDIVKHGIAELEKPDSTSRTPDNEGRRIVRLDEHRDWGWRIVNFQKYRESANREMLKMGEAERKAEYRKRKGYTEHSPIPPKTVHRSRVQKQSSPDSVRDISGTMIKPTIDDVIQFCNSQGLPSSDGEWFFNHWESNGWTVDRKPIVKWKSVIVKWKIAGHCQSQKLNNHSSSHKNLPVSDEQAVRDAI